MSMPPPSSSPPRRFPLTGVNLRLLLMLAILFLDVVLLGTGRLTIHGASDEVAHILTALLWGVLALSVGLPVSFPFVALGGVFPDLDHVPMVLFGMESLPHSSRSVLHTLLVILVFLGLAATNRRWARVWGSLALGVASHLARDMATGTVILLWPVSWRPFSIPYLAYLDTLALCVVLPAFMPRRASDKPAQRLRQRHTETGRSSSDRQDSDRTFPQWPDLDTVEGRTTERPQPRGARLTPADQQR